MKTSADKESKEMTTAARIRALTPRLSRCIEMAKMWERREATEGASYGSTHELGEWTRMANEYRRELDRLRRGR